MIKLIVSLRRLLGKQGQKMKLKASPGLAGEMRGSPDL